MSTKERDCRKTENFSRFEINHERKDPLPIFPLTYPNRENIGVMLVGDYIAPDLIHRLKEKGSRNRWLVISTTQSDHVPTQCATVDFNFFTNQSGVGQYLSSPASHVPYSTELGDGHYVDPDIFYPSGENKKKWDILYPAKYYPTKQTELLLTAAALDPNVKIAIIGWPVVSERKAEASQRYRKTILDIAKTLPNVAIFDNTTDTQHAHTNPDGSTVVGRYTKEQMRMFFVKAKTVIFLSETTEAINRVCTEALCCNTPILVAPTSGGLDRLVTPQAGAMIERSPQGILDGLKTVDESPSLSPRQAFTRLHGKQNANRRLKEIIREMSENHGKSVNLVRFNQYGGDLWVPHSTYAQITDN